RFLIHHGGAGTSMAVCRGGIPSIVIPHNSDQFYWALKLYELGVAPRPLKRARATRDRLEALIKEVAQNPQYQSRATELRRRVQTEDGVGTAAGAIAQLVAKLPK
ncbi:MAG TPA: glycosyltransferase, partial [Acidobacteriota bacterium]|nr:glycosyltransferase [Acidobacteriota bacterium]